MPRVLVHDDAGAPLPGVPVTDGAATASTGADGSVVFTPPAGPFAQVSVPDGWDAPDGRWFAPWAPTVAFTLRRSERRLPFSFVQLTDLHLSVGPAPVRLTHPDGLFGWDDDGVLRSRPLTAPADVVAALDGVAAGAGAAEFPAPSFAVLTGDLTDHGTAAEFALLDEVRARAPVPLWVLPGNHDHDGHRHEPAPHDAPEESGGMGTMTTWRYERHVGPRWWSRTVGGLHVVALDWFAWRVGADRDRQEAWLAGDLGLRAPGTPVLLLTHDHMPSEFFRRLGALAPHVRLVGSLSGHWHTSRVVTVDGARHVNTGNATFGSYDWSPAHGRLLRWDGERLDIHTVALGGGHDPGSTFRAAGPASPARLPGAVHLAAPARAGDVVVCAWRDDDRADGGITALDAATGEPRWTRTLAAPVWAAPSVALEAGLVVAVTVNGTVHALELTTGAPRWTRQVGDPLAMWVHAAPLVDAGGGRVVLGEYRTLACLDLATGAERWMRDDFGRPENTITASAPALAGGVLVVGFGMYEPNLYGLDPATGATVWTGADPEHRCPLTDVVPVGEGDAIVGRMGGRLDRVDAATGARRWTARLDALFLLGRPWVLPGGDVVVATGTAVVHRVDGSTGAHRWRTALEGEPALAFGPYRRRGPTAACSPVVGGDGRLWMGTADGAVHRLDPDSGAHDVVARIPAPVTAAAVPVPGGVLVVAADGGIHRFGVGELASR